MFFDHFGPATEVPGSEHDVRPHPHIGLATVTYLFEGAMMHRDSLGSVQEIRPGAINWMTAGRGIVHSERKPERLREATYENHGLQLWAALPLAYEEAEPSFAHTAAEDIPSLDVQGVKVRVLVGEAFGARSPVATFSKTIYLDLALPAGARFELPALAPELAIYAVDGDLSIDGEPVEQHTMAMLADGEGRDVFASSATKPCAPLSSAASRSTARASSPGTSFRAGASAFSKPARIGLRSAWAMCPARPNSFRCRAIHSRCSRRPDRGNTVEPALLGRWCCPQLFFYGDVRVFRGPGAHAACTRLQVRRQ